MSREYIFSQSLNLRTCRKIILFQRKANKLISPENDPPLIEDEASTEGKFVNNVSTDS